MFKMVDVDILHRARAEILRAFVSVVRNLRLAHFLADLGHKRLVHLIAQCRMPLVVARLFSSSFVLALHVVENVEERGARTALLFLLGAVLAKVHLRLMLRDDWLPICVGLVKKES